MVLSLKLKSTEINSQSINYRLDIDMLKGKKVAILGDRDGIPGPDIEECVKSAGAEVVFSTTECFV